MNQPKLDGPQGAVALVRGARALFGLRLRDKHAVEVAAEHQGRSFLHGSARVEMHGERSHRTPDRLRLELPEPPSVLHVALRASAALLYALQHAEPTARNSSADEPHGRGMSRERDMVHGKQILQGAP